MKIQDQLTSVEENLFAQITKMKKSRTKKNTDVTDESENDPGGKKSASVKWDGPGSSSAGQYLTNWCRSEGQLVRQRLKGKTRFHRIRAHPVKCECKNYYCQCGPNPALEAIENEKEHIGKDGVAMGKATNASVLREAAILLKEDRKEREKILELLSATKNYLDYEKYLEELRETLKQEALVELEKKHLSGQLSYEEAILAKQRVIEENAKRREEYLDEKAALEEELEEFKQKELAKIKEMVREVQEQHEKAKAMHAKTAKEKQKAARKMTKDIKEMLRKRVAEREKEIERKIAAIREFKILQQIKKEELNSREEKMTRLVTVSMEELKARLALYKRKMRDELMKKRTQIQKQKCRQEMIRTAATRFVQQVKNCREEMRKLEVPKTSRRLEDGQLNELRAKLEEARMKRHSCRMGNKL